MKPPKECWICKETRESFFVYKGMTIQIVPIDGSLREYVECVTHSWLCLTCNSTMCISENLWSVS